MKPLITCATVLVLSASTVIVRQLVGKNNAPNTASEGITRPLHRDESRPRRSIGSVVSARPAWEHPADWAVQQPGVIE
jgi:hypothetical protein